MRSTRCLAVVLCSAAVLLGMGVGTADAAEPPGGHTIIPFPSRDFVSAEQAAGRPSPTAEARVSSLLIGRPGNDVLDGLSLPIPRGRFDVPIV